MTYIESDTVSRNYTPGFAPSVGSRSRGRVVQSNDDYVFVPRAPLAHEFQKHKRKWARETRHLSSPVDRYMHPSYVRIIGLGPDALGLILADLKSNRNDWFYALQYITGENPITSAMAGDYPKMIDAWVGWGVKNGYL